MDFTLSKEQEMARTLFREVAENEIKPLAAEIDEEERFPKEALELFRKYKFMGMPYSKEYGGAGCDTLTYEMCLEKSAKCVLRQARCFLLIFHWAHGQL